MPFCWFRTTFSRRCTPARFSTFLTSCDARPDCAWFAKGTSVVIDFHGNTKKQQAWFRTLFEHADVAHELHFIDVPDDLCKRQLKDRSQHLPVGSPWTTDADLDAITAYFEAPAAEERFNVIRYQRG